MFYFSQGLKRTYESEVKEGLSMYKIDHPEILTVEDIKALPVIVQKYLYYVGAVGKPKVWNFRACFSGKMKQGPSKDWMNVNVIQYNFFKNPVRMFYIDTKIFGIPVYGIHAYKEEKGTMLIKAAGLIPVVDAKGAEMNASDTVTIFNDMCLMAPASLIDQRIVWEELDGLSVKAIFTNGSNKVSAELYFDEAGKLSNFISYDRYMTIPEGYIKLKWSTPVESYKKYGDSNVLEKASATWQLPDQEFKYAEFDLKEIEYNCKQLK